MTHRTRSTSVRGAAEAGKVTRPLSRSRRALQRSAPGAQDQQRQLRAVGAQLTAEAVEDLPLAREHQASAAGRDAGLADLAGDRRPFLPQLDDRRVDRVDAIAQAGDA